MLPVEHIVHTCRIPLYPLSVVFALSYVAMSVWAISLAADGFVEAGWRQSAPDFGPAAGNSGLSPSRLFVVDDLLAKTLHLFLV